MQDESRFGCPSAALALKHLLWRTSHIPWAALGITLLAHGGSTLWRGTEQKTHMVRPLTIQFVKRQPRLTKPLELRKRPAPKRRSMQRKMVSVQARIDRQATTSTVRPMEMVQSLARPDAEAMRSIFFAGMTIEPQAAAQAIESRKEAASQVDMSLEMMDVSALDTGQYQAMVIQDPQDRTNIHGFFHFAYAYSVTMRNLEHGDTWRPIRAIRRLLRAVNHYTDIQCDLVDVGYTYDSRKLFLTPLIPAVTRWPFKLTTSEATNLGQYLMVGGFLFIDPISIGVHRRVIPSCYGMAEDALATQGLERGPDYRFEKLPNAHTLYHCFFDFDGPPASADTLYRVPNILYDYLEGVTIDGRLRVIMSKKWYFNAWGDWGLYRPYDYQRWDPQRPLQFGVNLIVFVLTQEGSITRQVMDTVSH